MMELTELSINLQRYGGYSRYPLVTDFPDRYLDRGLSVTSKSTLFEYGYWDTTTFSKTDADKQGWSQFRTVGLEMSLGIHLTSFVDMGLFHRSEHLLDVGTTARYPLLDAFDMTIYLYKKNETKAVLPW